MRLLNHNFPEEKKRGRSWSNANIVGNNLKTVMRPNTSLVTKGLAQKHLCQGPDWNWYEENLIQKVTDM